MSTTLLLAVEGIDDDSRLRLGDAAALVIEGVVPPRLKPELCFLDVTVSSAVPGSADEVGAASFSLSVAEFMSGPGPFLCQIDFEAETVGEMVFDVDLLHRTKVLAQAQVAIRVINPLRDASGKRRLSGSGALKVKK